MEVGEGCVWMEVGVVRRVRGMAVRGARGWVGVIELIGGCERVGWGWGS